MIKKAGDQPAFLLASQEGLEPPTPNLEGSCSIRMSYWLSGDVTLDGARGRTRTGNP